MFPGLHPLFLGRLHATAQRSTEWAEATPTQGQACLLQPFPEALRDGRGKMRTCPVKREIGQGVSSRWVSENVVIWDEAGNTVLRVKNKVLSKAQNRAGTLVKTLPYFWPVSTSCKADCGWCGELNGCVPHNFVSSANS